MFPAPQDRKRLVESSLPSRRMLLASGAGLVAAGALSACAGTGARREQQDPAHARELFSHLGDQQGSVAPIDKRRFAERRARLGQHLSELGIDALIAEPGTTYAYLGGVPWGRSERLFALVVLADGKHFWICPAFEEGKARGKIDAADGPHGPIVTWREDEYAFAPLAAALRERRVSKLAIEPQMRFGMADRLAAELGRDHVVSAQEIIVRLRGCKEPGELAILRRANELTQLAILEMSKTLAPGLSGDDVAARMAAAHERLGMRNPWCLALIGPAAALPHGDQHDIRLKRGDVLLVDTGASLHGYQSDITRTWVVDGSPSTEIERAWNAVRDAQRAAYEMLRPGVVCRDVDARARAVLAERGYGSGYAALTHRLGHGIGLEGHEDPYFDGGSAVVLQPGMTLSDEPGIYRVGEFGIRIEDIVAITDDGADHFGTWQRGPRSPA
jgi:Xaa-Pro dipeptidase